MTAKGACRVASVVLHPLTRNSRGEKEAEALVGAGFDVTVYAFASKGLPPFEERSGYVVERLPVRTRFLGDSFLAQALKMIEFSLRVAWRLRSATVVHCHDFQPLPAAILARVTGLSKGRILYDAHELESEKNGLTPFRSRCVRFLEKVSARWLDGLISVSPSILEVYRELLPAVKGTLILNCPRIWPSPTGNALRRELGISSDVRIILYQGSFVPGRNLEQLLEAFRNENNTDRALVFLGYASRTSASRSLETAIKDAAADLPNVFHLPAVSPERLSEYTGSADLGVALIEDVCLSYRYCLPNKFFEFAMAGLPIVVSDLPEMRRMVEEYECGVICRSRAPGDFQKALDEAFSGDLVAMGARARRMAEEHCWERQEKKLLDLYDEILEMT